MKIGYQLKQVRERLAKGLVDKGILRTEKRNFLLFDMATHPVVDGGAKDEIRRRVRSVLTNRTVVLPPSQFLPDGMDFRYMRTVAMLCAAYAANVLENALTTLGHEARERAFAQVDELLAEYSQWPFGKRAGGPAAIGANLDQVIRDEVNGAKDKELQLEVRLLLSPSLFKSNMTIGRRRLSQRLHTPGLSALRHDSPNPSNLYQRTLQHRSPDRPNEPHERLTNPIPTPQISNPKDEISVGLGRISPHDRGLVEEFGKARHDPIPSAAGVGNNLSVFWLCLFFLRPSCSLLGRDRARKCGGDGVDLITSVGVCE